MGILLIVSCFSLSAQAANFCKNTAQNSLPSEWIERIAPTLSFYETSSKTGYAKVTPDFDCHGMSVGMLQWNIGSETVQPLLRKIISANPQKFREIMGPFSDDFQKAMRPISTKRQLKWVRKYQSFKNKNVCKGGRGASWSGVGKDFQARLGQLMNSKAGRTQQNSLVRQKLNRAWKCANWWAESVERPVSIVDVAAFADTLTFNGGWWHKRGIANAEKVKRFINSSGGHKPAFRKVLMYLESNIPGQDQSELAKKNASLWRNLLDNNKITNSKIEQIIFSYLIADAISKPAALRFKYLIISRRGTIVLQTGYVNDKNQPIHFDSLVAH